MSLLLPQNPDLREMCDVEALAKREGPTLREAINSARRTFAKDNGSIHSLTFQVILADGTFVLMSIGPRGGRKILHRFGKLHG